MVELNNINKLTNQSNTDGQRDKEATHPGQHRAGPRESVSWGRRGWGARGLVATWKLCLCALRARPSWDWLFSWLLFGQTLSCRDPMHRLSPTQLGRRPTGRQTLPALDAKCSFGHSKKRRRHLCVPLCRELLITKTQREMGPNLSPAHPNCHLHVQPRKQKARECRNDGGGVSEWSNTNQQKGTLLPQAERGMCLYDLFKVTSQNHQHSQTLGRGKPFSYIPGVGGSGKNK